MNWILRPPPDEPGKGETRVVDAKLIIKLSMNKIILYLSLDQQDIKLIDLKSFVNISLKRKAGQMPNIGKKSKFKSKLSPNNSSHLHLTIIVSWYVTLESSLVDEWVLISTIRRQRASSSVLLLLYYSKFLCHHWRIELNSSN